MATEYGFQKEIRDDTNELNDVKLTSARAGYIDELAPANIPTDVDAILVDTDDLQSNGVKLNATGKTDVNAEVDGALDTAIPGSPTADSVNERLVAIDDLTQAGGAGDLAAILVDTDDLQSNGVKLSAQGKLDVNAECDTALTDYDAPTKAELDAAVVDIKGSGDRDLTDVYNKIGGGELTTFDNESGIAAAYVGTIWVEIFSDTPTVDTEITGIQISNSGTPTTPVYRICHTASADGNKIFPFTASLAVESGILKEFRNSVSIPAGTKYIVEVNCAVANGNATLDELDIIKR